MRVRRAGGADQLRLAIGDDPGSPALAADDLASIGRRRRLARRRRHRRHRDRQGGARHCCAACSMLRADHRREAEYCCSWPRRRASRSPVVSGCSPRRVLGRRPVGDQCWNATRVLGEGAACGLATPSERN
ncbi:hypothetical protein ACRAWF_27925, partial [Streptomyces sp. L7]